MWFPFWDETEGSRNSQSHWTTGHPLNTYTGNCLAQSSDMWTQNLKPIWLVGKIKPLSLKTIIEIVNATINSYLWELVIGLTTQPNSSLLINVFFQCLRRLKLLLSDKYQQILYLKYF